MGRFKSITRAVVGNNEYRTANASGFFGYFGALGGQAGKGYPSFDAGPGHVVALNSNCGIVSCAAGSAQATWLRADLGANPSRCTLAIMHHPLFSSTGAQLTAVSPLRQILHDEGAEVVLTGHQHKYERFAPQTPSGARDDTRGLRLGLQADGGGRHHRHRHGHCR